MSKPAKMTVNDWRRGYGVVDPTDKEVISYTLWHRLLYTSGTTTQLTFFTVAAAGLAGNLPLGGQLPNGWSFLIQAMRVGIFIDTTETDAAAAAAGTTDGAIQDVSDLIYKSHTALEVGPKEYGRWPTYYLPAGGGPYGQHHNPSGQANPNQFQWAAHGLPDPRAVYTLPIPVVIPPQYDYRVVITWPTAVTLTAGDTYLCVSLDGELMRPKQ